VPVEEVVPADPIPPSPDEIAALPPFAGGRSVRLALPDLVVLIEGLPAGQADGFLERYRPFAADGDGDCDLRVMVRDARRSEWLPPDEGGRYRMAAAPEPGGLRLAAHGFAGWFRARDRVGAVALCHGRYDPPERALENYLRACVAWVALERGGLLLHSASIVRGGAAYLFFGASGAGKSTLASLDREGRIVSDDLTLLMPGPGGRLHVVGTPFRGTYTAGDPVTGRHPLHSAYRLRQDERTFVARASAARATAALLANLTFVIDQIGRVPGLAERLEPRLRGIPTYELHFRRAPDFWRALEAFHGALP
jgi:hypothetical protein